MTSNDTAGNVVSNKFHSNNLYSLSIKSYSVLVIKEEKIYN